MKLIILDLVNILVFVNGGIVTIPNLGKILGSTQLTAWTNKTIFQYLSIKYAKSPSGKLRFAQPIPVDSWDGIYDATQYGISCPQIFQIDESLEQNDQDMEDCLSLNVYTPENPESDNQKLLPVLVYIHGGGFLKGNVQKYYPEYLLEKKIILVTIQYRLGALGTLSLDTDKISGNMGLLDQVLALEWVHANIKHFGGNHSDVTLMGQSSGAFSVSAHLLSPIVDSHLFQKVIIQSGGAYGHWGICEDPINYAKKIYQYLTENYNNINDTVDIDVNVMEETFLNAPLNDILKANLMLIQSDYKSTFQTTGAVIQKAGKLKYLTEYPNDILKSRKPKTMPMLSGVTKNDGSVFALPLYNWMLSKNLINDDYLRNNLTNEILESAGIDDPSDAIQNIIYENVFKNVFKEKKSLSFKDLSPGIIDLYSIFGFKSQVLKQVKINSRYVADTYLYSFDYKGDHKSDEENQNPYDSGISHSDDLFYLFSRKSLNDRDTKMAKIMIDLWTNFIINGKPYSEDINFKWRPIIKGENGPFLHINEELSFGNDFVESEFFTSIYNNENKY